MEKILEILSIIRPEADYRTSSDYLSDGLLDSFDIVLVVSELDKAYNITIPGAEIIPENFRNAGAIYGLVNNYRK